MRSFEMNRDSLKSLSGLIYIEHPSVLDVLNVYVEKAKAAIYTENYRRWINCLRSVDEENPMYELFNLYVGLEYDEEEERVIENGVVIEERFTPKDAYKMIRVYSHDTFKGTVRINKGYREALTYADYTEPVNYLLDARAEEELQRLDNAPNVTSFRFLYAMGFNTWEGNREYCKYIKDNFVEVDTLEMLNTTVEWRM